MQQSVLEKRSHKNTSVTSFTLTEATAWARRARRSVRLKVNYGDILCGCFQCRFGGDIAANQALRLAQKSDGTKIVLHIHCELERGMTSLIQPRHEFLCSLQEVPGINGTKPR